MTRKPILILCYNEPVALKLASSMEAKGLADRVHACNFHKWCRQQLVAFGQTLPAQGPNMFDAMVDNVIRAVDRRQIPSGQYQAVLVDEGHDFAPEWLKLVTHDGYMCPRVAAAWPAPPVAQTVRRLPAGA